MRSRNHHRAGEDGGSCPGKGEDASNQEDVTQGSHGDLLMWCSWIPHHPHLRGMKVHLPTILVLTRVNARFLTYGQHIKVVGCAT